MAKNVLIVDDSATMRKIIMRGLQKAGIDDAAFSEAADGRAGLAAVQATKFDLILSDVDMPGMNGLEFVTAVTQRVPTPPPIIMIATEDCAGVVQEAIARGAKGWLHKPFTTDKIRRVIGPFLE